jgi:hypothetical protein
MVEMAEVQDPNGYPIKIGDEDVVNPDALSMMRKGYKAHIFHDHGVCLAVVIQEYDGYCCADALDEAIDSGKLDRFKITEAERADYEVNGEWNDRVSFLGNAGEPFDIESLGMFDISIPAVPLCTLLRGAAA